MIKQTCEEGLKVLPCSILVSIIRGENIKNYYKNNKVKIPAPIWNDKFELLDGLYSISDIIGYLEHIIKKS